MLRVLEAIFAILGVLLGFVMFLVVMLGDSLSKYLDAQAEDLRRRTESKEASAE